MAKDEMFVTAKRGGAEVRHNELCDSEFSAAVDRALVEMVSPCPSTQFQSALRSKIAAEPEPSLSFWRSIFPASEPLRRLAAATVAMAIAVAFVLFFVNHNRSKSGVAVTSFSPPAERAVVAAPEAHVASELRPVKRHVSLRPAVAAGEPEVLVSKAELSAVLLFYEENQAEGGVAVGFDSTNAFAASDIAIPPIVIAPLFWARLSELDASGRSDKL
jgi:hypothetical protein